MENSDNKLEIPDNMSKELFKKALQNGLGIDNVEIDNIKISLGSAIGDNYTSVIYRVQINYHEMNKTSQEIFLIVKSMILKSFTEELQEIEAFHKEVRMYKEIMPRIEKLYKNKKSFSPKCFYVENQSTFQAIVLQDLKAYGYSVADRIKRLDEAHSKVVLRKLGQYHAGTMVLFKQEPNIFKFFDKGFFQPGCYDMPTYQSIFKDSLEKLIEHVQDWKGYEVITQKLKNVLENFKEIVFKHLTPKPNDIRVLNHSDVWTNNMMFKYNNGLVDDLSFIDLQVSTNDSPALDILYFLNTSVDFDVLEVKRNELIKYYYDAFEDALKELNFPNIPSWNALQNDIKNKEFFGFMVAVGITPVIILDRELSKDSTFEAMLDKNAINKKRNAVYSSERYKKFMKYSLKRFDELGLFD